MSAQKGNILVPILAAVALIAICAAGYFYWSSSASAPADKQNQQITTPTPVPTTQNEIANWETYESSVYKFQIKYPEGWKLKQGTQPEAMALAITTITSPSGKSLLDIWVQKGPWEDAQKYFVKEKAVPAKTNSIDTLFIDKGENGGIYSFPSIAPGQVIQIVKLQDSSTPQTEIEELNQILSTFKFTN